MSSWAGTGGAIRGMISYVKRKRQPDLRKVSVLRLLAAVD
jgi:hypothetical protein